MPMQRRLPKRGFKNPFRVEAYAVNLDDLAARFESGTVDLEAMRASGLVPRSAKLVKVLGRGELSKALTVSAHRFSETARQKIEAAGGTATVLGGDTEAKAAETTA
jgi:large subunit ribosomal protein L15